MIFQNNEAFIGLGAAISRATIKNKWGQWSTNPFKARRLHCTWKEDGRTIDLEGYGSKRVHYAIYCPLCKEGISPLDVAHDMSIHSKADSPSDRISCSYTLPWEKEFEVKEWHIKAAQDDMYADGDGTIR